MRFLDRRPFPRRSGKPSRSLAADAATSSAVVLLTAAALLILPLPAASQYCSVRGCCPGRNDECTVPFSRTLCYCDVFCKTTAADCCPDFLSFCFGTSRSTEAPPITRGPVNNKCFANGVTYNPGASVKVNCNQCSCVPRFDGSSEFVCDTTQCLVDPDIIDEVNSDYSRGWRASNYSFLWGLTLQEGVLYRLGTFPPGQAVASMIEVVIDVQEGELPDAFDARAKWPGLIDDVIDQGNCGSSWAVSTASVASDRLSIQSKGGVNQPLSEQHLLSCNVRGQRGCSGGYLDRAWWFTRRPGIVSRECYPYASGLAHDTLMKKLECRIPYGSNRCPELRITSHLYQSTPPYRIAAKELDIMTEIYRNGPVQATFQVKKDFFVYRSGVYRLAKAAFTTSQLVGEQPGWHSVKIVGWGVDRADPWNPIKYWLCMNSWGRNWGENGLFRIVRGENESEIESFILGVWMRVDRRFLYG